MNKLLLIDNFDSFTYNLLHLIKGGYTGEVDVVRNNELDDIHIANYEAIVISPGPGRPDTTPSTMNLLKQCFGKLPIFGVCLGMQCLNELKGGKTIKAPYPVHGKSNKIIIETRESILFKSTPSTFEIARYHSLQCIDIPSCYKVTAKTVGGISMAIEDHNNKAYAVQFHPESFLSEHGSQIIRNFLELL